MSTTPVSGTNSNPISYTPPAAPVQSAAAAATEEATETASQTRREAAHGDQVAIRKIAKQDLAQQPAPATTTTRGATGNIDLLA